MSKNKRVDEYAIDHTQEIFNRFLNLAINRFSWEGLPYGLTSEQLVYMLVTRGQLACYKSKNSGILILPCFGESYLNAYGLPTIYRVESLNGYYNERIDIEDMVLIKNKIMMKTKKRTLFSFPRIFFILCPCINIAF